MVNFIHLFVAMKENAYLVSGNNDLIKIVRENKIYAKSLAIKNSGSLFLLLNSLKLFFRIFFYES